MLFPPEAKSPLARQVSVDTPAAEVRTFATTTTEFSVAGIDGVTLGSASGKLIVLGAIVSFARAATVALIVNTLLSEAARVTEGRAATANSTRAAMSFLDMVSPSLKGVNPTSNVFGRFPLRDSPT